MLKSPSSEIKADITTNQQDWKNNLAQTLPHHHLELDYASITLKLMILKEKPNQCYNYKSVGKKDYKAFKL